LAEKHFSLFSITHEQLQKSSQTTDHHNNITILAGDVIRSLHKQLNTNTRWTIATETKQISNTWNGTDKLQGNMIWHE